MPSMWLFKLGIALWLAEKDYVVKTWHEVRGLKQEWPEVRGRKLPLSLLFSANHNDSPNLKACDFFRRVTQLSDQICTKIEIFSILWDQNGTLVI